MAAEIGGPMELYKYILIPTIKMTPPHVESCLMLPCRGSRQFLDVFLTCAFRIDYAIRFLFALTL